MPQSENWPFRRLQVDHLFHGTTRVWWGIDPTFTDPGPYTYQLQAGYTGNNNALDWQDVGDPVTNAMCLEDDTIREHAGKHQLTHYRVVLATDQGKFVSNPQGIHGNLDTKDWLTAREIIRKERLRMGLVSQDGFLLRKFHFGQQNRKNTDFLTDEITDSQHPESWGTAFQVGYHPPVPLEIDFSEESWTFLRGGDNVRNYSSRHDEFIGRTIAFPEFFKEDVWVDADTDERFKIHQWQATAALRGVPLVYSLKLRRVPSSDIIYKIPVDFLSYQPGDEISTPGQGGVLGNKSLPTSGNGCVMVDHDYDCPGVFIYQTEDCCFIDGATIHAFSKEDWTNNMRLPQHAVATSHTTTGGTWTHTMKLNPGEYILVFEKCGEYGPDHACLTVHPPDLGPPPNPYCNTSSSIAADPDPIESSIPVNDTDFSDSFGTV